MTKRGSRKSKAERGTRKIFLKFRGLSSTYSDTGGGRQRKNLVVEAGDTIQSITFTADIQEYLMECQVVVGYVVLVNV